MCTLSSLDVCFFVCLCAYVCVHVFVCVCLFVFMFVCVCAMEDRQASSLWRGGGAEELMIIYSPTRELHSPLPAWDREPTRLRSRGKSTFLAEKAFG